MKKQVFAATLLIFLSSQNYAQTNQKWSADGNTATNGDFIGTINNEPLILKANNIVGLRLKPNGQLIIKSLDLNSSAPNGIVLTNGQGEISRLNFNGNSNNILLGDGTWGTLPTNTNFWQAGNGNKIYYTAGKVGIGTQSPNFDLDVQGNARITNTLIVNGQLIISDKIQTSRQLKSMRVETDSIMMDSTRAIYGRTVIKGDVQAKFNLGVDGNIATNGSVLANQGFTFDGNKGISYTPETNGHAAKIHYGKKVADIPENCAAGPQPWANHQFGGMLQIFDADPTTGQYVQNSGLLNFQTWSGGSSIDASIGGEMTTTGGLLLNYFCGNDTYINTGALGGKVSMGKIVEIGMPTTDNLVALNVKANTGQLAAIQSLDENNQINFKVYADGVVYSREINVKSGSFPDYVFNENYKLTPLSDVEKYIKKYKHLQGFETGKIYEQEGMPLGEIVRLQQEKIEELTLYLIELKKEIDLIKTKK